MIRTFEEILAEAGKRNAKIMVVPYPQSKRAFSAVVKAKENGLILPVLIGDKRSIEERLTSLGIDEDRRYRIIDEPDPFKSLARSIEMIKRGEADMAFQGDIGIKKFLSAFTDEGNSLSYISLIELPSKGRIVLFTDTYIHEFPDLKQKADILANAISLANVLGMEKPKVAVLSMAELVNLKTSSSIDAAVLSKMSERKQFRAIVDGPLDIDCASSRERAIRKGLDSPVSGKVDIYLLPDIETGYPLVEVLTFLGGARTAGALMGSDIPVVLNLRFEPADSILINIALATMRT